MQERVRLDAILTLVDAKHALEHLKEEKEEGVENEVSSCSIPNSTEFWNFKQGDMCSYDFVCAASCMHVACAAFAQA